MSIIKKLLKSKAKAIENKQYAEAASLCNTLGYEYRVQENYEDALNEHLQELKFCEEMKDQLGTAVANRLIGECYTKLNKFKKALHHIECYYDISVNLESDVEKQRALTTFGVTYFSKYVYDSASGISDKDSLSNTLAQAQLAYCRALKLLPRIISEVTMVELSAMKCRLLHNLGLISEAQGDHEQRLKYGKEAMDIALQNNLNEDIDRCGYALGTFYQKIGKHKEAEDIFNKTLTVTKKLHNKNRICEVLLAKGLNLISLERYKEAIKCFKSAYKLHTTNSEDFEKITRHLKICIGIDDYETKLKTCKHLTERKKMLETIADALSSIEYFNLAIEKYHMTLECMDKANLPLSEKAPIYFSLAQTYFDNGNISAALEYFEKEYNCNKEKPTEQIQTLLKIAEILENENKAEKSEEFYRKAVLLAEEVGDQKYIYNSLTKLSELYAKLNKTQLAAEIKKKISKVVESGYLSDENSVNEEDENPFDDICLSDLSDSDNNEEKITSKRRSSKKIESKVNELGETPLHQACINGNFNLVKQLVKNGHSVNIRDHAGWTPLHEACNHNVYNIVEFLLENGADVNDPGGPACGNTTPLHDAASGGYLDIIQLLISKGANVTAIDENGETPLDVLLKWKKEHLIELDDIACKQCKDIEDQLKFKMSKAGVCVPENNMNNSDIPDYSNVMYQNANTIRKRNRTYSSSTSSSNSVSEYDDDVRIAPYLNESDNKNLSDAKTQYKTVMENLRRSAANVTLSPVKSKKPKISLPALVNENEIVNDWLIEDVGKIPKTKKRKMNKLNVRSNKCMDKILISHDSEEEKVAMSSSDECSITTINSVNENVIKTREEQQSCPQKSECSVVAFCLRVNIAGKPILVPVPEDTCTVSWLKEEAAKRFQAIDGSKPHLILTKNGALLSGSDLIKNIFCNNEEVFSSVEMWDEPSLDEKYVQLCNKHNAVASSDIKKRFCDLAASFEMNLSNCYIPNEHLSIIFLTLSNYRSLKLLNLNSISLSSSIMSEIVSHIKDLSVLHTLNLSCCNLTSEKIKIFLDYLNDQIPKASVLPNLKVLDLSYNYFCGCPDFTPFLKLSLCSLNLCSCELDSTFLSSNFLKAIEEKQNLEELDISENTFTGDVISNFLHHLPKESLKKLNFRCIVSKKEDLGYKLQNFLLGMPSYLMEVSLQSCFLTDEDLNIISTSLTFCPQLQIIDLSVNPLLTSVCMLNFFETLCISKYTITDLNITETCNWEDCHSARLENCLKLKKLKHFCFNNCPKTVIEKLKQLWIKKWENRASCRNMFLFYEFSIN